MSKNVDPNPYTTAYQAISDFQKSATKYYNATNGSGYAYASGYFGSMLASLIADLPRERRRCAIDQLNRHIKEIEDKYLIECLSSNDKG